MAIKKASQPKRMATKKPLKKAHASAELFLPALDFSSVVTQTKKPVSKKMGAKAVAKKKASKKPEVILVEELNLGANEPVKLPMEISKEYVIVHRCTNCEHIPFSLTRLVTLFSVLIMILSVSVLVQIGTVDISKLLAFIAPSAEATSQSLNR